jgi:hypothetical protein
MNRKMRRQLERAQRAGVAIAPSVAQIAPADNTPVEKEPTMPELTASTSPITAGPTTVEDSNGRKIAIRKLGALDRLRLFEMLGPSLSENALYLGYSMSAACVTEIDGVREAFPSSKKQIEIVIQRLGDEGLEAVTRGYRDNFSAGETGDTEAIKKS